MEILRKVKQYWIRVGTRLVSDDTVCTVPPRDSVHNNHRVRQTCSNKFNIHGSVHRSMIQKKQPTRCNLVTEFIIPPFIKGSTCFERYTAHHQEL